MKDVLSGVFNFACDEELIETNPVNGVSRRLNLAKELKDEAEALTPDETRKFLDACVQHGPEHFPFFQTASFTGMRLGELLAVRWSDIDWNSHLIVVQRSYRRGNLGRPKRGKARRIDMSDQLEATLKALLQKKRKGAG